MHRTRERWRATLVAASIAVLTGSGLSSCAGDPVPDPRDGKVPTLLVIKDSGDHFQAVVEGDLGTSAMNCFTVGGRILLAYDPSSVLADGSGIKLAGFGVVHLGDRLTGGGGTVDRDRDDIPANQAACIPEGQDSAPFITISP